MTSNVKVSTAFKMRPKTYNRFLLLVVGLGGVLYGIDLGIIAGALPYLETTSGLNAGQVSFVVAAVLLGSLISLLFAGLMSDAFGRKRVMIIGGLLFVISVPMIALSHSFESLILGRLCQGISVGLIAIAAPMYLAESLLPKERGRGTAMFQWLLTIGIMGTAGVSMHYSFRVAEIAKLGNPHLLFLYKDHAWRNIFWASLPPGVFFVLGCFGLAESPRWLFRRGRKQQALSALLRSRNLEQGRLELEEMEQSQAAEKENKAGKQATETLLQHKYVIPFLLACVILACTQATGINSIIGYNTSILIQGGLSDVAAHWGYILFTIVQALATIVGIMLVDRRGRKFLLSWGTAGIVVSLLATALLFNRIENRRVDVHQSVQAMVGRKASLKLYYTAALERQWLMETGHPSLANDPTTLTIIYSYGDFSAVTPTVTSKHPLSAPIQLSRSNCVPGNKVVAFFSNPFGNLRQARTDSLRIQHALITPLPSERNGWLVAITLFVFVAFYAMGPGICGWLAMSELLPTRIRSNGMSIACVLNTGTSTSIAAIFLPTVGRYGYAALFAAFAGFTVIYFLTATFFLPETKGKSLEEIEAYFSRVGKEG
jgi:Na+/melibiose symporter-like transporter